MKNMCGSSLLSFYYFFLSVIHPPAVHKMCSDSLKDHPLRRNDCNVLYTGLERSVSDRVKEFVMDMFVMCGVWRQAETLVPSGALLDFC